MNRREFFNSMAEKWDTVCIHDANKIEAILDMVGINQGANVLDIGTGTGVLLPYLQKRIGENGHITAIDIAEGMLKIARTKYNASNITFIHGDFIQENITEDSFDIIICYSVFPHFDNKQIAVSKMARLLKDGGICAICHSQSRDDINKIHQNSSNIAISEDLLPEPDAIKGCLLKQNMNPVEVVDNSDMFVIVTQKYLF